MDCHPGPDVTASFFVFYQSQLSMLYHHGNMARSSDGFHPGVFIHDPVNHCLLGWRWGLQPPPISGSETRVTSDDNSRITIYVHHPSTDQCFHHFHHHFQHYTYLKGSSSETYGGEAKEAIKGLWGGKEDSQYCWWWGTGVEEAEDRGRVLRKQQCGISWKDSSIWANPQQRTRSPDSGWYSPDYLLLRSQGTTFFMCPSCPVSLCFVDIRSHICIKYYVVCLNIVFNVVQRHATDEHILNHTAVCKWYISPLLQHFHKPMFLSEYSTSSFYPSPSAFLDSGSVHQLEESHGGSVSVPHLTLRKTLYRPWSCACWPCAQLLPSPHLC